MPIASLTLIHLVSPLPYRRMRDKPSLLGASCCLAPLCVRLGRGCPHYLPTWQQRQLKRHVKGVKTVEPSRTDTPWRNSSCCFLDHVITSVRWLKNTGGFIEAVFPPPLQNFQFYERDHHLMTRNLRKYDWEEWIVTQDHSRGVLHFFTFPIFQFAIQTLLPYPNQTHAVAVDCATF